MPEQRHASSPRSAHSRSLLLGRRVDPLLEEVLAATVAMTLLAVIVAAIYWAVTGLSPWPGLVLGELAGFGFGVALLSLASPRPRR